MRSSKDLMKRANLSLEQVQTVGISCSDCLQVGRIVECRLKQKGAYGLHPAAQQEKIKNFLQYMEEDIILSFFHFLILL